MAACHESLRRCAQGADYPRASRGLSDVLEDEALDGAERLAEHAGR